MFCIKCGTQLPDKARFCPNCGADLLRKETQPEIIKKLLRVWEHLTNPEWLLTKLRSIKEALTSKLHMHRKACSVADALPAYCYNCGAEVSPSAKYCPGCGVGIDKQTMTRQSCSKIYIIIAIIVAASLLLTIGCPMLVRHLQASSDTYTYRGSLEELLTKNRNALNEYITQQKKTVKTDDFIVERQNGINDDPDAIRYQCGLIESYDRFEVYNYCVTSRRTGRVYLFAYMYDIHTWLGL